MRLIIIRHGDPDYSIDSLTERGWREAELLSDRIAKLKVKNFYVSPLGRAKDTASLTLKKMNRTAEECEWLREFPCMICRPDAGGARTIAWDWLPEDWTADPRYFDRNEWCRTEIMREGGVEERYRYVTDSFDALLAVHGYVRGSQTVIRWSFSAISGWSACCCRISWEYPRCCSGIMPVRRRPL